ncbi:class I SAM-dependent methyltransferase [Ruminococcus sp. FC2018]|uniref:class I SAM-dependent methyltransferase n=1 Tax=Ruminococcus sp. FC2018 TaxID=1410617 RepID=UPI00048E086E|nr:class I SAM-dependent methyltransferase [Ruminococcus sp. FC2018]
MDNTTPFKVSAYDENVRRVIPFYNELHEQVFSVIRAHFKNRKISLLDTGCGTGTFALKALDRLDIARLTLCDPSENMLTDARAKLAGRECEFYGIGSQDMQFEGEFDAVTAIQSHHYFDRQTREKAVTNCFKALKKGGIFVYFENTAPLTETGRENLLARLGEYQLDAGRTPVEVDAHLARYGAEYFPINIKEHLQMLENTGFAACELFWASYMQCGFYAVRG